jgi:two-component system alkaline phosphatase synthesis response regulator PhoP
MRERILIVDDEEDILELLRFNLTREGYQVRCVATAEEAFKAALEPTDLILLDLMLPGVTGFDVAGYLRADPRTKNVPIVMVTAKGEEADVITGLELGADDYITKPFSPRVLVARIRAVLRRKLTPPSQEDDVLRIHDLVIDPGRREVQVAGTAVSLTFTEFEILRYLARRPGWVFTRTQIVDAVRGEDYAVTDRSVDVQIVGLRRKLGLAGKHIETIRGVGYRFKEL